MSSDTPFPFAELDRSFRTPATVTHVRCHREALGLAVYPVCPRCGSSMDREYQAYCDRCGQCLSWKNFHRAVITQSGK